MIQEIQFFNKIEYVGFYNCITECSAHKSYFSNYNNYYKYFLFSCQEGLTHENLYSPKNNRYRKKSAAFPAAALSFARSAFSAHRDRRIRIERIVVIDICHNFFGKAFVDHLLVRHDISDIVEC